ncbi:CehA/McbA family metallohydrolase [Martelella sp. HB161492]|uniref:CehA/McbA family metallohydrolase n=1 Tax=Martelella sp. HB161492 TaxID=2720726 RepID=UPI001592ACF9|nr:CehA/McbA family metallohydrolase [Martelella sp. HB161492]
MGREGIWLKGDFHLHSRHSSDSSHNPVEKIIGFAEAHGFDYLAITDHDVHVAGDVAGHTWADPAYRSEKLLLFYGAELTAPRGHANILSAEPYNHQRVFDHRNARDWDLLTLKRDLGIHWSANHPVTSNHYGFSFDIADSIEIWNTSVWPKNAANVRVWDNMLLSGRMIGARGGSDAHHGLPEDPADATPWTPEATANYVGTPTTWVFAAERTKTAILAALCAGRACICANPYNPRVALVADADGDGTMEMMMGDNAPATGRPVQFEIRLSEGGIAGAAYQAHIIKNRQPFATVAIDPQTRIARFSDIPAQDATSYYRVEIDGPQAIYADIPYSMAQSAQKVALSNPLYFNYDPDF